MAQPHDPFYFREQLLEELDAADAERAEDEPADEPADELAAPPQQAKDPVELPPNFLDGPPPNLIKKRVEFAKLIPEYEHMWAVVLDGVLSEEECALLVAHAEGTSTWERALVNIGMGQQAFYEDIRKCGRIIMDDRDLAAKIWKRVEAAVPEIHRLENWADVTGSGPAMRDEVWNVTRLNERMRFLKYIGGEYFKPHCDGNYQNEEGERSYFTMHLYLNGASADNPLKGGETIFHGMNMIKDLDVVPKPGRVLIFQQRGLLHSGDDVVSGTKYTMRTDIMYKKVDGETSAGRNSLAV